MLDELYPVLGDAKARDLLNRLEDKRVEQALPAEMELGLLWAIGQIGELQIEPEWWGNNNRPDAYTEQLVPGNPCAIEIAATSDNAISGEEAMDNVAVAIGRCADRLCKGISAFFYYRFREEYGYENGRYFRRRLAPSDYELSENAAKLIENWIANGVSGGSKLRIVEPGLDVEIERAAQKQIRYYNVWSSMPPETHSIDDNPLYKLLKRKAAQLKGGHRDTLRFIFLSDVGSALLNGLGRFGEVDHTRRRVSGSEILSQFMQAHKHRIDAVVVFAPQRTQHSLTLNGEIKWSATFFGRAGFNSPPDGLHRIVEALPRPRFEGYQARSLFRQGSFSPKRSGWYLGMSIEGTMKDFKAKVPARAFLDFLAGRISVEQFRHFMGQRKGESNFFENWLNQGFTLCRVDMEPRNVDEDDDHLVLHFSDDPAARVLRINPPVVDD
jgi:hypothetical protein